MLAWSIAVAAALGGAPLAAGCGSDNSLVGGQCAAGYTPCGTNCCPTGGVDASLDRTSLDAPTEALSEGDAPNATDGDGAPTDGFGADRIGFSDGPTEDSAPDGNTPEAGEDGEAGEAGPVCMPPLVDCGGTCVDTTSDPLNCGQCGNVCPSQICQMSQCVGSTAGGVVFIGHDYLTTPGGTAQARVLSNAVFIPQSNPLHVLSYERYANAGAITRIKSILDGAATQIGRTLTIASTTTDSDVPNNLTVANYGVLLVADQSTAPAGALATLGSSWASTLATFTQAGGIVVVLDGGTGTGEMPQFSSATGLLTVSAQAPIIAGTALDVVAPADAVGTGVVSPYGAGTNSVSIDTEANGGNVVYVVDEPVDGATGLPVVVHKAF